MNKHQILLKYHFTQNYNIMKLTFFTQLIIDGEIIIHFYIKMEWSLIINGSHIKNQVPECHRRNTSYQYKFTQYAAVWYAKNAYANILK